MSFGPALKTKHTEKHWPPSSLTIKRKLAPIIKSKDLEIMRIIYSFMVDGRFYGAEWQEEKDFLSEYMGWIVFEKYRWLNKTELDT